MKYEKYLSTTFTTFSHQLSGLQVVAIWTTTMLDLIPHNTFLSIVYATEAFMTKTVGTFVCFITHVFPAMMATISGFVTTLLFTLGITANNSLEILWSVLEGGVSAFSSYVLRGFSTASSRFTHVLTTLTTILKKLQHSFLVLALKIPESIPTCSRSIALAIPVMVVVAWLSRPTKAAGKTRADHFADLFAQRCAISRDHQTTSLVGLTYLLASSTVLHKLALSSTSLACFVLATCFVWVLRAGFKEHKIVYSGIRQAIQKFLAQTRKIRASYLPRTELIACQTEEIKNLNEELAKVKHSEKVLKETNQNLQKQISALNGQLHTQTKLDKIREHTPEHPKTTGQDMHSNTAKRAGKKKTDPQVTSLKRDLDISRLHCANLLEARNEALFEIEVLKSTAAAATADTPAKSSMISHFAIPFVLVLVDGDAYMWSKAHFAQPRYPPGANAAQAIKLEVQKYLINHKSQIPIQSRIVVKVFQNLLDQNLGEIRLRQLHGTRYLSDFSTDFTQSMPLFDYIDSGRGKERADSKIQETAHLFIANASCHAIFLAAATDNGFARMLEQYAYDEAARQKIVLVHPGHIVREISALGFEAVEWPSVFQKTSLPRISRQKAENLAHRAAQRNQHRAHVAMSIMFEGTFGVKMFSGGASGKFRGADKDGSAKDQAREVAQERSIPEDNRLLELD